MQKKKIIKKSYPPSTKKLLSPDLEFLKKILSHKHSKEKRGNKLVGPKMRRYHRMFFTQDDDMRAYNFAQFLSPESTLMSKTKPF